MKTSLRDTAGNVLKEIDLSDTVYAAAPNPDLLHQALVYHQANQRQGTHDTLTRGGVSGGGRPHAPVQPQGGVSTRSKSSSKPCASRMP